MVVNCYSNHVDRNKQISSHFKVKEFACNDGTDPVFVSQVLIEILEAIRSHFGKPVHVNSGYRTVPYNKKVGGTTHSRHCLGLAADIRITGVKPSDVADYARLLMPTFGGVGRYPTFTHVDVDSAIRNWKSS